MEFANKEAEDFYLEIVKEHGYIHINSKVPITVESLEEVRDIFKNFDEKKG